jgi:hypothetical protein
MNTVRLLLVALIALYLSEHESDQCGVSNSNSSSPSLYSARPDIYDYKINIVRNGGFFYFSSLLLDIAKYLILTLILEFILTFGKQVLKQYRHEALRSILDELNITDYSISEKNLILDGFPSDFDVIKVRSQFLLFLCH